MRRSLVAAFLLLFAAGSAAADASITLHVGKLLDGRGGFKDNVTVTVQGSRIVAVEPGSKAPPTYELKGLTLMPGGIDTHVHIG